MAIQEQNIKLLASEVMDDVPEGGGQATGNAITDGASNAIFPDISELDRTYGRVNLRKTYVGVHTPDTDKYFGANVIVADPPSDEKVACTLFTTDDGFDTRESAATRIEAYLFSGAKWPGLLLENHIAGQRTVSIMQREGTEFPPVGKTLVLVKNEGLGNQQEQYVRITRVSSVVRTFTDSAGDFKRVVLTCDISDALRYDFAGHSVNRFDSVTSGGSVLRDTNVADAAKYYGVSKLTEIAVTGALSAKVESIFTQLVPSAQTEVPATDVRSAGDIYAPIQASSDAITLSTSATLAPSVNLYVGAGIMPGTLTISAVGATLTDANGKLMNAATEVGAVDYTNGVVSVVDVTYSGSKTVSYKQAAMPSVPTETLAINVTAESRSLSIAVTIYPIPAPATLQIHYMAQGRWYVIRERGTGAITGDNSGYGAGQLSFTTGGMTATFGALPDVGSKIILFWGQPQSAAGAVPHGAIMNGTFSFKIGEAIKRNSLVVSWNHGGVKTASEVGGTITGDASGVVIDYQAGAFSIIPSVIPPVGTVINIDYATATSPVTPDVMTAISLGSAWEVDLESAIKPGTFSASIWYQSEDPINPAILGPWEKRRIFDDGAGEIKLAAAPKINASGAITNYAASESFGTINYTTGVITYNKQKVGNYTTSVPETRYVEVSQPAPESPPVEKPTPVTPTPPTPPAPTCDPTKKPADYVVMSPGFFPETKQMTFICEGTQWVAVVASRGGMIAGS